MNKTISVLFATTIFTAPVLADQLQVVVDIPPVHGIVEGVLGSNASITTLISRGIDPHNYTMKPSHAAALSAADLIVLIGESLTPSLAEKLPSLASNAQIIELAKVSNVHLDNLRLKGSNLHCKRLINILTESRGLHRFLIREQNISHRNSRIQGITHSDILKFTDITWPLITLQCTDILLG